MTTKTSIMPIENIPDWEKRIERQDAFWSCEIIDRPPTILRIPKETPDYPEPESNHKTLRDRWLDAEYQAEMALSSVSNLHYLGDALPSAWPNLGPEVFSAYFGLEMEYGENTSWSIPNIGDWSDVESVRFSMENEYWKKTEEMTDALLAAGKGVFYAGITDLHPGGDAVVAFRDPLNMNLDMIENPDQLKSLLGYVQDVYFRVFDHFYEKLKSAGQPCNSWPGIVSSKKWYVPSNDFSCMVSEAMFDEFFLPGIAAECRHMEANIYHLDGPTALRHLDSLLEIKELNAIQWIYGAGNGRASDWIPVYQKCQAAGKGVQIHIEIDELETMIENLKPNGVWLAVYGLKAVDEADAVLKRVSEWR